MLENYFNYFTEIEEHYRRRRGAALLLSTLDWALIETWKDAGIPLAAVLRGIDSTFDKYDRKPACAKTKKVNSLAYCSQEVLTAADDMKEAATGAAREKPEAALDPEGIRDYLRHNARLLRAASATAGGTALVEAAEALEKLAAGQPESVEALERHLTVLETKLFATLMASADTGQLLAVRAEADRDIAPYRSKMPALQMEQLHRQYVNKRLLERAKLPRLSLFYM